jgi:hypothetical protein
MGDGDRGVFGELGNDNLHVRLAADVRLFPTLRLSLRPPQYD